MNQNVGGKRGVLILCAVLGFTLIGCKKETPEADVAEDIPTGEKEAFTIELGVGVGPVKFGMSEEQVIEGIGQPDETETVTPDVVGLDYISSRGLLLALNPEVGVNYISAIQKHTQTILM